MKIDLGNLIVEKIYGSDDYTYRITREDDETFVLSSWAWEDLCRIVKSGLMP